MADFTALLIHTCTIQSKTLQASGYEKTQVWGNIATDVPCRHDSDTGANITDGDLRVNTDDDIFFFNPGVTIKRGNRIVEGGKNYDVIKVNKLYDASVLHHLEVRARYVDHD